MYSYMPLYFDEYGWGFDVLSSPAEKLSYLMSSVYQYKTWGVIKEDPFFKQVIKWLNELDIVVNQPKNTTLVIQCIAWIQYQTNTEDIHSMNGLVNTVGTVNSYCIC